MTAAVRGRVAWSPAALLVWLTGGWVATAMLLVVLGSSLRDASLVGLGVVLQLLTGALIWRRIRGFDCSPVELLGMGLALGTTVSVLAGVLGNLIVGWVWWWLTPLPLALIVVFLTERGNSVPSGRPSSALNPWWMSTWWPVIAGMAVGLGLLLLNLRRYPLAWSGVWDGYHPDMVFFEALGSSTAIFGASDSAFMVGGDIRYHWLTYAWAGQLTAAFDAAPFMVLTRALPLVALVGLILLVIAFVDLVGRDLKASARIWACWIAVALVVPGGYLGAVNGTILNFDSPSQALSTSWLLAVLFVLVLTVKGFGPARILWPVIAFLAFAVTGGKVSAGAVAVAAAGVPAVAGLALRRPWGRRAFVAAVIVVAAVAISGLMFVWGAASPGDLRLLQWNGRASTLQGLNSSPINRGVALGTLTFILAMSARWLGAIWLFGTRRWRERIEPWLALGLVSAAVAPVILFAQGVNETWFALTASAPLAALAAIGVVIGWERAELGRGAAAVAVAVGGAGLAAVSYIWTDQVWESGFGRFWGPWLGLVIAGAWGIGWGLLRAHKRLVGALAIATLVLTVEASLGRATPIIAALVGGARDGAGIRTAELAEPGLPRESRIEPNQATDEALEGTTEPGEPGEVGAARSVSAWSDEHAAAADYLRMNADRADVIITNETEAFLVPALTRMRTYISGVPYQALYGSTATAEAIPERLETNTRFLESGDEASLREVCAAGAAWVWLASDRPVQGDMASIGTVEFENDSVTLVRIVGCDS